MRRVFHERDHSARHEPAGADGIAASRHLGDFDDAPCGRHLEAPAGARGDDVERLRAVARVDDDFDASPFMAAIARVSRRRMPLPRRRACTARARYRDAALEWLGRGGHRGAHRPGRPAPPRGRAGTPSPATAGRGARISSRTSLPAGSRRTTSSARSPKTACVMLAAKACPTGSRFAQGACRQCRTGSDALRTVPRSATSSPMRPRRAPR